MFERFTRSAREAVTWAEENGRRTGATHIGSGDVLLGAVNVENSVAARALARLAIEPASLAECLRSLDADALDAEALAGIGIDLAAVRSEAEATFGAGALDPAPRPRRTAGHVPFDPAAKKMLELSLREAIRFKSKGIDTGHLLLAAARLDGATAQKALAWFGPDRAAVEAAVVATWADDVSD